MKNQIRATLIVLFALPAIAAPRADAALVGTPAYAATDPGSYIAGGYSIGFEFTPTVNITVTALGYVDYQANGLAESHEVAIFLPDINPATGTLVPGALVTVTPADSNGGLDDIGNANVTFAYHALTTPVTLLSGITYRIAGQSSEADPLNYSTLANHTSSPFITTGAGVYFQDSSPAVEYPANVDPPNFYSTPNFLFTVPEPASLGLLVLGGASLLRRRR